MTAQTGYELSGETRDTYRNEESSFLARIQEDTDAEVEVLSRSVMGYPIWGATVGTGSTILIGANVHPREPAGREAVLMWFRDLAYRLSPGADEYLQNHRVVIVPNILTDGIDEPKRRENLNGININRDYIRLTQPEARAVAKAVQKYEPVMIMDMHQVANAQGHAWRPYWNAPEQAHPDLLALGEAYTDQASANIRQMNSSWTTSPYTRSLVPWGQMATTASAWHAVGILNEVAYVGLKNAVDISRNTLDTMQQFHQDNRQALDTARENSINSRLTEPIRLPTAEQVYQGEEVYVQSSGSFRITGTVPTELFDLHGIQYEGNVVPLDQPAQRLVAYLLSSQSSEYVPDLESWEYAPEGEPIEPIEPGRDTTMRHEGSTPLISDGHVLRPVRATLISDGNVLRPIKSIMVSDGNVLRPIQ